MPIEYTYLSGQPLKLKKCPKCGEDDPDFMRGMVQRSKRFLGFLWRRDYCAVICHNCHEIIGYESPPVRRVYHDPMW